MMPGIKKNRFVACIVVGAVFFLFSGCAGLNRGVNHLEPMEKNLVLPSAKVSNEPVSPLNKEAVEPEIKQQQPPSAAISKDAKQPLPEKNDVIGGAGDDLKLQKKNRFERAKGYLGAPGGSDTGKTEQGSGSISFNFDNADLYEVIRTLADILSINYIVDPNVRGNVTIHTAGELKRSDLFPLFFQILEANGLTALKEQGVYKIITKAEISKTPLLARYGRDADAVPEHERMVMQIVPLDFISSQEIVKTLTPFLSDSGTILPQDASGVLIVVEKGSNIKRLLELVDLFDVDILGDIGHRFFRLQHTEAKTVSGLLSALISPYLKVGEAECDFITIERLNTVVAISEDERILNKVAEFVKKIDREESSEEARIFVYKIKNGEAEELSSLLNQVSTKSDENELLAKNRSEGSIETEKTTVPPMFQNQSKPQKKEQIDSVKGNANFSGDIKIIPDLIRNALIIEAAPSDYRTVTRILKEIDILPRQVLINVLVVDVSLTKDTKLGVEWSFTEGVEQKTGVVKTSIGEEGLTFSAGFAKDWNATLSALATDDNADILSSPSLMASDNKTASINVATQIPITTSSYDTDNGVTTTSVQYRDTGIILSVTPHINDYGMVTMDIDQEVSNQADSSASADHPSFFKRNVKTTLTVKDRQTIVIGGLISETTTDVKKGVPWLFDLPFIGPLFGSDKDSSQKNELILFITPHVIKTVDDIDYVSREFTQKLEAIKDSKRIIDLFPDE